MAILTWLGVPGEPTAWESLGFRVGGGDFAVGSVLCAAGLDPAWGFDVLHADPEAIGVTTREKPLPSYDATSSSSNSWDGPFEQEYLNQHPNRIDRIDHVVYAVPELEPAVDALTAVLGEGPRRRDFPRGPSGPEMAFFTVGNGSFIEVVASGRPPALWGIAFWTNDLDACVAAVREAGGPIGDPKSAVQGGRIASVWKEHVGWGVAVMEPPKR